MRAKPVPRAAMRRASRAAWLLAACVSVASATQAAGEGPPVARLDGTDVQSGSDIRTPEGTSQRLTFPDGVAIVLRGGTSIVVGRPQWFPPEKGEKSIHGWQLFLREGELTIRMPSEASKPPAVSVMTSGGQSLLAWRGVSHVVARDGAMTVAVDHGAAYVGAEAKWRRVGDGESVIMRKKAAPEGYKGRLVAPTWVTSGGALGFAGAESASARVSWQSLPDAARYRIEVARDPEISSLIEERELGPSELAAVFSLPVGTHYARVVGIDREGLPSAGSKPIPISIRRLALPSGGFVAPDGVLVVPPKAELALEPLDGYELASAGGADIDVATRALLAREPTRGVGRIRLDGEAARAVRVRDAAGAEGQLRLVRREVRAKVQMAPAKARWPDNPIDATVRLESPNRRADVSREPVTLEVRINAQVVPAEWQREGDTMRTRIKPVDGPGPWLVSVVVKDATTAEIGSYILDVDGPRPFELRVPLNEQK